MPKISVIVPVYNVEKFLPRCVESILMQTLDDLEIICIDDGSMDESGRILDGYAVQDERLRVVHQENRGYGAAMNTGLAMAEGEYIGIVESDDCILPEMYQTLYQAAVEDDLELVKSDAFYWIESVGYMRKIHDDRLERYYDRVLCDADRNRFFDFYMNIWTGIYKREYLELYGIRFHESPGASYQDNGFWIQSLLYCRKAKWLSDAFYLYRQDNPAASVRDQSKSMVMTREYEFLERILRDRGDWQGLPYCCYYRMYRHRGTFLRIEDGQKRLFCEQIRKDFAVYKGYVRGSGFLEDWLYQVATDPDRLCEDVIGKKQEIRSRLSGRIIVYGAGRRGDAIFRILYGAGYYDRLCCFAVSQRRTDESLNGKPVLNIEDAVRTYPDAAIIVAVTRGSGMYRQMTDMLAGLGVFRYVDGTDMEEHFYKP